jgi:hypothetical protein
MAKQSLKFFEDRRVRSVWDEDREEWFFSVVDVVNVLAEPANPRKYWSVLKTRLRAEGSELTTKCSQLKLMAEDGKFYNGDVLDTENVLRLVQSIPSKKAEPFKLWLARVGRERIDEIDDPELAIDRAMRVYERKGYSREWINLRLKSIETRKDLTDEWDDRGVRRGNEYAILTDDITQAWSGMTTKEYKKFKNLKRESLRDNMSNVELVLNMLGEVSTAEISKAKQPETFSENRRVATEGGTVARKARQELEAQTEKSAITSKKFPDTQITASQLPGGLQRLEDGDTDSQPSPPPTD